MAEIIKELESPADVQHFGRNVGFNSGEHSLILVNLPDGVPSKVTINDFTIDLRKIAALPDFFYPYSDFKAIFDSIKTIAMQTTQAARETVFDDYFNIAFTTRKQSALTKILGVIADEETNILNYLKEGKDPSQYYKKYGNKLNIEYALIDSDYIVTSLADFDHFSPDALIAYRTGRDIAFKLAYEQDEEKFAVACATLAFTLHYFTDSFAAGHMATPRYGLVKKCGLLFGSLLAKIHHDEANRLGFNCQNNNKETWVAFGDGRYFDKANKNSSDIVETAVQLVFLDLLKTYQTGQVPKQHLEENALPTILPLIQQKTCAPLFLLRQNEVLRRREVSDPLCKEYIRDWQAIPTLIDYWLYG